jgi:hypothetical protein
MKYCKCSFLFMTSETACFFQFLKGFLSHKFKITKIGKIYNKTIKLDGIS